MVNPSTRAHQSIYGSWKTFRTLQHHQSFACVIDLIMYPSLSWYNLSMINIRVNVIRASSAMYTPSAIDLPEKTEKPGRKQKETNSERDTQLSELSTDHSIISIILRKILHSFIQVFTFPVFRCLPSTSERTKRRVAMLESMTALINVPVLLVSVIISWPLLVFAGMFKLLRRLERHKSIGSSSVSADRYRPGVGKSKFIGLVAQLVTVPIIGIWSDVWFVQLFKTRGVVIRVIQALTLKEKRHVRRWRISKEEVRDLWHDMIFSPGHHQANVMVFVFFFFSCGELAQVTKWLGMSKIGFWGWMTPPFGNLVGSFV